MIVINEMRSRLEKINKAILRQQIIITVRVHSSSVEATAKAKEKLLHLREERATLLAEIAQVSRKTTWRLGSFENQM